MKPGQKIAAREAKSKAAGPAVVAATARRGAPPAKKPTGPPLASYAKPAGPPAPGGAQGPRVNINYKDLAPDEQDQAAKKAGITPGPSPAPPGVVTAAMQQTAAEANEEAMEPKAEEATESPTQETAEEGSEDKAKSDLAPPAGHHAVAAHVRKNPVVSKVYAAKLKKRGVALN